MRSESKGRISLSIAIAILCWAALLLPVYAGAAVFQVDSTADSGDASAGDGICADSMGACTLRAAIRESNELAGPDEIRVPEGAYTLPGNSVPWADSGLMDAATLTGAGTGRTTLEGVLYVSAVARVEQLTIRSAVANPGIISEQADLELDAVVLKENGFFGVVQWGGRLHVERSAIHSNEGGSILASSITVCSPFGCFCSSPPTLELVNSTFSSGDLGAIWVNGCAGDLAMTSLVASTLAGSGEAIQASGAEIRVRSTLLTGSGCILDPSSTLVSLGHNLDSDGSCGLTDPTDLSNVDPLLGPLQDNGGPTPTHALLPGSPAIDAIPPADCTWDHDGDPGTPEVPLATDQRGAKRPQGGGCDIGAFEVTLCSDALDNDADGQVDSADPGCRDGLSVRESPQCQDGLNNDNATGIDFDGGASLDISPQDGLIDVEFNPATPPVGGADPQCSAAWKNKEKATACGLGYELALLAPLLGRLARRRRR